MRRDFLRASVLVVAARSSSGHPYLRIHLLVVWRGSIEAQFNSIIHQVVGGGNGRGVEEVVLQKVARQDGIHFDCVTEWSGWLRKSRRRSSIGRNIVQVPWEATEGQYVTQTSPGDWCWVIKRTSIGEQRLAKVVLSLLCRVLDVCSGADRPGLCLLSQRSQTVSCRNEAPCSIGTGREYGSSGTCSSFSLGDRPPGFEME